VPFGEVSWVGRGMGVLDEGGDRRKGRCSLGAVNLGRPFLTNGDFVASSFSDVRGGDAALPK